MNTVLSHSLLNATPDYHSHHSIKATLVDVTSDLPIAKIQRFILSLPHMTYQQYLTQLLPFLEVRSLVAFQNNTFSCFVLFCFFFPFFPGHSSFFFLLIFPSKWWSIPKAQSSDIFFFLFIFTSLVISPSVISISTNYVFILDSPSECHSNMLADVQNLPPNILLFCPVQLEG